MNILLSYVSYLPYLVLIEDSREFNRLAFSFSLSLGEFLAIQGVLDGESLDNTGQSVSPDGVTGLERASALVVHLLNLRRELTWTISSLEHNELLWRVTKFELVRSLRSGDSAASDLLLPNELEVVVASHGEGTVFAQVKGLICTTVADVSDDIGAFDIPAVSQVKLSIVNVLASDKAVLGHVSESVGLLQVDKAQEVVRMAFVLSFLHQSESLSRVRLELVQLLVLSHNFYLTVKLEAEDLLVIWLSEVRGSLVSSDSDLVVLARIQSPLLIEEEHVVLAAVLVVAANVGALFVLSPGTVELSVFFVEANNEPASLEAVVVASWG